jgi:hypothetical protein
MSVPSFDKKEMKMVGRMPSFVPGSEGVPVFDFPMSAKEAYKRTIENKIVWIPYGVETGVFTPQIIPDNIARGFVIEKNMMPPEEYGGFDMFGIEWEFVPVAGGSMEKPGNPHPLEDANDWKEKIVFPDINSWDWDKSGRENKEFLDNGKANMFWFLNGAGFERLISFFGFEGAAMALIDEEQIDAVKDLLAALTDLHKRLVDCAIETYGDGISGFTYHDDWGSQRSPFFSFEVGKEVFVPYWKELTSYIKSKGMIADLHSCGKIEAQVENIIEGGWQSWSPMNINDTKMLYEKYGDRILIGVCDSPIPQGATPEQKKQQAMDFVKNYYSPEKPSAFSLIYSPECEDDAYFEGLYEASRQIG